MQNLDCEKDRDNTELDQRRCLLLVNSQNGQVTISNICRVKECFSLMAIRYDQLFHELDHAIAHLRSDIKTALSVAEIVAHVLFTIKHVIVDTSGV